MDSLLKRRLCLRGRYLYICLHSFIDLEFYLMVQKKILSAYKQTIILLLRHLNYIQRLFVFSVFLSIFWLFWSFLSKALRLHLHDTGKYSPKQVYRTDVMAVLSIVKMKNFTLLAAFYPLLATPFALLSFLSHVLGFDCTGQRASGSGRCATTT